MEPFMSKNVIKTFISGINYSGKPNVKKNRSWLDIISLPSFMKERSREMARSDFKFCFELHCKQIFDSALPIMQA
jgi:hypothetical protein